MYTRFPLIALLLLPAVQVAGAQETQVDEYIKATMAEEKIPALSLCVSKDDRIVKTATYGLANVELNVAANPHSEFAIASITKSITASAVLLLVQDGKLSLDDPITKYIPRLPADWSAITVRQLLTHTSGIKDHYDDFPPFPKLKTLDRRLEYTDSEFVKAHTDAGLNFPPGQWWAYSGSGYIMLGMIISKVTGHPYQDFMRTRIFESLGMNDTHFIELATIIPNRVSGYRGGDPDLKNGYYTGQYYLSGADASVMMTAADLCKWEIGVTSSGIWKPATVAQIFTPAKLSSGNSAATPNGSYGFGWAIAFYNGYPLMNHTGGFNIGFSTFMGHFPEQKMNVVVLTSQWNARGTAIGLAVAGMYDPQLTPPERRTPSIQGDTTFNAKLRLLAGAMFGVRNDVSWIVTPGYQRHLNSLVEFRVGAPPVDNIRFIASDDLSLRGIVRNGAKVARMNHYRVSLGGDPGFVTLYLTADGKVADVFGY